ncbi:MULTISPECIES: DUF5668 domain-containing protein [Bacillaceae]|uniref:LiaI-LiaF-like domain-containing protein n=1 Tax=Bacillaceae TaxID=186817 RepID=UPI000BA5EC60|nr:MULTISPECIES: DUF5668 domain-containing protein [Bacillaceae]PAE24106.1 hypothetical protein CHI10_14995 [Bacillus sp. 7894-2]URM33918.1 DUF5668 domain-containing protein [Cytobacillus firmus]
MKNQRIFPGIILLGFGAYFFLQQSGFTALQSFYSWPTLLIIVGAAFLIQGYGARDYDSILPGVILTGFGLHFHVVNRLEIWPDHIGTFILIIALGFLLRHQKTGAGLFQGILFLILAALLLFYDRVAEWMGLLDNGVSDVWQFWPILLMLIGLYFLLSKKK